MPVHIVNPRPELGTLDGIAPPPFGYLLLSATIAPPKGPPFVRSNDTRSAVLASLPQHLAQIRSIESVVRATGYRAVLIPPARASRFRPGLEPPRFDVAVLIETNTPDDLGDLAASPEVAELRALLDGAASRLEERRARCVRAIADVQKQVTGTYLFNYWVAADRDTALEVFDHLAPWFEEKTGLENSTVLQSLTDDEVAFVNHARWDEGVLSIAAHQFLRPSFFRFVRPNLKANQIEVYPALYKRV